MKYCYLLICAGLMGSFSYGQTLVPDIGFANNGIVVTQVNNKSSIIHDMLLQNDGKIVAAGETVDVGFRHTCIARYNTDGSPDNSFGVNGMTNINVGYSEAYASVAIQADGKIIAAGNETVVDTVNQMPIYSNRPFLARYKTDGTLDSTFGVNGIHKLGILDSYTQKSISGISILPDGRIVVAGSIFSGLYRMLLVCLETNGTYDVTFELNGLGIYIVEQGEPSVLYDMEIQQDGKMVLAGYSGLAALTGPPHTEMGFIRVNSNGDLDNTFGNNGTVSLDLSGSVTNPVGIVNDLQIDASGNIFAAGNVNNGLAVVKLNTDGILDASFGQGGVLLDTSRETAQKMCVLPDGDILVTAIKANGNPYSTDINIHQASASGVINTSFGNGGDLIINSANFERAHGILVQNDGKILIGGYTANQTSAENYTLWRFSESPTGIVQTALPQAMIYPNPVSDRLIIHLNEQRKAGIALRMTDITGRTIISKSINAETYEMNITGLASGVYMLELYFAEGAETFKIVKQ
jgi:uncharacterized delta-60 repeat protein